MSFGEAGSMAGLEASQPSGPAAPSHEVHAYAEHWDRVHATGVPREWHSTWETLQGILRPYLTHAATACSHAAATPHATGGHAHATYGPADPCGNGISSPTPYSTGPSPASPAPGSTTTPTPTPLAALARRPTSLGATLIDVGCGTSGLGLDILGAELGFNHLLLLDASLSALEGFWPALQQAATPPTAATSPTAAASQEPAPQQGPGQQAPPRDPCDTQQDATEQQTAIPPAIPTQAPSLITAPTAQSPSPPSHTSSQMPRDACGACVEMIAADCRRMPVRTGSVAVVLDKGTLDALWSDADKASTVEECARVMSRPHGLIASVSFASPIRLALLSRQALRLGLCMRVHVVGQGDPARGHEVRFLTLLSQDFGHVPHIPDSLTTRVLMRIKACGSMLDEEADADLTSNADSHTSLNDLEFFHDFGGPRCASSVAPSGALPSLFS